MKLTDNPSRSFASLVAVLAASLIWSGCETTTPIESRKEPGQTEVIKRIFVISSLAGVKEELAAAAELQFTARLRKLGIEHKYVSVSPLGTTQDHRVLYADITQFKPDGILVLSGGRGVVTPGGTILSVNVNALLHDPSQMVIRWHGLVRNASPDMAGMAQAVIGKLQEDGLLRPGP